MPYNIPAGVAAFGGGLSGRNAFNDTFGSVAGGYEQDQSFDQVAEVLQLENALSTARQRRVSDQREQQKFEMGLAAAAQARQREQAYINSVPADQRALAAFAPDIVAKRQADIAFRPPPGASDRYRVVGNQIYDVSGDAPKLAAAAPRAPGRPIEVWDPELGRSRYASAEEAIGMQAPPDNGITVGPDGTIQIGGNVATPLGKRAQGEVELNLINTNEKIARLDEISARFDPKYLQLGERMGQTMAAWKDKLGMLDAGGQAALAEFAGFRQAAFADLNMTLKEMSGAAVTPQEAERQLLVLPNPGEGIFDGDSPAVFQRKMLNSVAFAKKAQARLHYLRMKGIPAGDDFGGISLDSMPKLIDKRAGELEKEYQGQGLPAGVVQGLVDQRLKTEFGI